MNKQAHVHAKIGIGFVACLLLRLVPFRPPNVEPLLAAQMPFAKEAGPLIGFIFGFMSIVLYDSITGTIGIWTLVTALTYGILGICSWFFLKKYSSPRPIHYALVAISATLVYDAVTGLIPGPLFFHQPLMAALVGQIPFTALHLIGNVTFAVTLSPLIHYFLVKKRTSAPVAFIFTPKKQQHP